MLKSVRDEAKKHYFYLMWDSIDNRVVLKDWKIKVAQVVNQIRAQVWNQLREQ